MNDEKYIELVTWNRKMILAYGEKLTRTQKAIGWRSNGLHSETRFSDRYGRISFSCTLADGCGCCRFKMIEYSHPYRQSRVRIPVTAEQEARLFAEACRMANAYPDYLSRCIIDETLLVNECVFGPDAIKYDKNGAKFSFISKYRIWRMHPEWMICNEAVANVFMVEWPDIFTLKSDTIDSIDWPIIVPPHEQTPDQTEYLVRDFFEQGN